MWIEPKTNWLETDYFNYTDYNRIKNNIDFLRVLAISLYEDFPFENLGSDKTGYQDIPYADEFNLIERDLEAIRKGTYDFFVKGLKEWRDNQPTPTYNDFNRIESACLNLYNGLISQIENKKRLGIRLGYQKGMIKV